MKQTEMFYKIQIRDYGIGIRDGEENKIFQRFYRSEQARGQEGWGIYDRTIREKRKCLFIYW